MTCRIQFRSREPDPERPKRIDAHIDDVASNDTRPTSIASDPCGETLLDGESS